MWKIQSKNAPSLDRLCGWTNRITFPPQLLQIIIFSVDESGKSLVKLEGESGKTISVGHCFPPKSANSGTMTGTQLRNFHWVGNRQYH